MILKVQNGVYSCGVGMASKGTPSGEQILGAHQHTFSAIKNVFLSKNFDQNIPKNAHFFGKKL